tara:strand:- start:121 stop:972 length:852 start_codon:yes stop_codon:yes gene_type:complete
MQRVNKDLINKRQLEKLIQAGAFDSIEGNRSKLFYNVPKFIELFGGQQILNQNLLFEESKILFGDKNLFNQKFKIWNDLEILINELEVIGFYFSDHPLNYFPRKFFDLEKISKFKELSTENNHLPYKVCGSILDIKERSNKDGRKYAFITVSERSNQYELTIFSENLYLYRHFLKEGNLLIFYIDIVKNNTENRYVIKKVTSLEKLFNQYKFKFNIYSSIKDILKVKDKIFEINDKNDDKIDLFINLENKLINFNFNSYSIKSFKVLDELKKSKIIDYSLEIS